MAHVLQEVNQGSNTALSLDDEATERLHRVRAVKRRGQEFCGGCLILNPAYHTLPFMISETLIT